MSFGPNRKETIQQSEEETVASSGDGISRRRFRDRAVNLPTPLATPGARMDFSSLRYAPSHEWAQRDGDTVTVGVTAFAVEQLTDVTYLELPKVGKVCKAGDEFGVIESVKSTSSLYAPVAGEVIEVNDAAAKDTAIVNADPFGRGWMVKFKLAADATLDHLLTKDQYDAQISGH
jgi:glycine cleavage system H protein